MSVQGKGANGHLLAVALAVVAAPGQRPCDHLHHDVQPRPQVIPPAYERNNQLLVDNGGECCLSSAALMTQTLAVGSLQLLGVAASGEDLGNADAGWLTRGDDEGACCPVHAVLVLPHVWGAERRGKVIAPRSSPSRAAREA